MKRFRHIFFIGVKGVAMAHLARLARAQGMAVSGADVAGHFITDSLLGDVAIAHTFDLSALPPDCDCVVYSAAHGGEHNPLVIAAQARGIRVLHQIDFMNDFIAEYSIRVGVAGCHGKTTTTSLLAYALTKLGADPGYLAGVSEFAGMPGSAAGKNDFFVVEADEYGMSPPQNKTPKLLHLTLSHAIITNIDFDHPDVYTDLAHTSEVFFTFASQLIARAPEHKIYICLDDPHAHALSMRLNSQQVVGYGGGAGAQARISKISSVPTGTTFTLTYHASAHQYTIRLSGEANVRNASGAIAFLLDQGYRPEEIDHALEGFTGAKRRFEHLGTIGTVDVYDDYAHHPHEIEATIQAFRMRYPTRRLIVVFQPHTFSRTQTFEMDFITALSHADCAIVLPIFGSAREIDSNHSISSRELVQKAHSRGVNTLCALEPTASLLEMLNTRLKEGDVLCLMGAGDVYTQAGPIMNYLQTR